MAFLVQLKASLHAFFPLDFRRAGFERRYSASFRHPCPFIISFAIDDATVKQ